MKKKNSCSPFCGREVQTVLFHGGVSTSLDYAPRIYARTPYPFPPAPHDPFLSHEHTHWTRENGIGRYRGYPRTRYTVSPSRVLQQRFLKRGEETWNEKKKKQKKTYQNVCGIGGGMGEGQSGFHQPRATTSNRTEGCRVPEGKTCVGFQVRARRRVDCRKYFISSFLPVVRRTVIGHRKGRKLLLLLFLCT